MKYPPLEGRENVQAKPSKRQRGDTSRPPI
jgi:hypothetical protein